MTRIAFYLPRLGAGVAEKSTLWIAQEVARRGHDVRLIADRRGGELEPAFAAFPVRYLDAISSTVAGPALASAVRADEPETLVAVTTRNILTAATMKRLGLMRTPLVGWEHNLLSSLRTEHGVRGKIESRMVRSLYGLCDRVIYSSRGAKDEALALCAPKAIKGAYVYDPAPAPLWQPMSSHEQSLAAQLSGPRIVAMGALDAAHDFSTLLRAFQVFSRTNGGSLLIIGEGPQRALLQTTATGLGLGQKVIFAGELENPANLLEQSDLFVSSARMDSSGAAIVEALALGVPVVATDCPTAPREILAEGQFGLLTPVGDPRALSRAMRDALQTTHDKQSLRARAADFSIERSTDAFLNAIAAAPTAASRDQKAA